MDILHNILNQNKNSINEEEVTKKHDHELEVNERMFLMNKSLDSQIIYESLYNLMNINHHSFTYHLKENQKVMLNNYVFQDIEMLSDHFGNEEKSIFYILNKCETQSGKIMLKELILNPICDTQMLTKRQELIKSLYKHNDKISVMIKNIKKDEREMLWFYNEKNMHHIDMMNDLIYFNYDFIPFIDVNGILNNNEKALLLTNVYKIFIAPALTIITPLMTLITPIILFFWFQRKTGIKLNWSMLYQIFMKVAFGSDSFQLLFKNPTKAVLANMLTKGLYVFLYFQNIYYSIQNSKNTHKIINVIHEKLNVMSSYVKNVNLLLSYSKANHLNSNYDSTIQLSLDNCIQYIQKYYELFNHSIFESNPSLFNNKGKILYTYRYFNKIKSDFIHLFHYVGMFDAYHSLGNIVFNNNKLIPYTFTTYRNSDSSIVPYVDFKDIWHPYLTNNPILNSLNLKNNHILITGPNAAGKSTFIKSVIVNILLSQTLGIASASSFEITPFKMIETYLQIPDSKGHASLFEAEMLRSKHYIDKLKKMNEKDFSFIVLDEIFSSTNYIEGFSGAYAILKKIVSFSNTLSMTTTHYSDLEYLENDTHGKIQNYHFEISRDILNNNILFNYKLKKGVSREYIALELLKNNGFDKDLIDDAITMSKRIHNKFLEPSKIILDEDVKEEVKEKEVKEKEVKEKEVKEKEEEMKEEEMKEEEMKEEEMKEEEVEEEMKEEEVKEEMKEEEMKEEVKEEMKEEEMKEEVKEEVKEEEVKEEEMKEEVKEEVKEEEVKEEEMKEEEMKEEEMKEEEIKTKEEIKEEEMKEEEMKEKNKKVKSTKVKKNKKV